mmetsp:Transcript_8099/g.28758  ORF Transcript_8099/g.28758 Transcript_8099/m.28758 type:complete len:216 (+) Transcript_8099:392-1039(+)
MARRNVARVALAAAAAPALAAALCDGVVAPVLSLRRFIPRIRLDTTGIPAAARRGRSRRRGREAVPAAVLCNGASECGAHGRFCEDTSPVPRIRRIRRVTPLATPAGDASLPRRWHNATTHRNVAHAALCGCFPRPPSTGSSRIHPTSRGGRRRGREARHYATAQRGARGRRCEDTSPPANPAGVTVRPTPWQGGGAGQGMMRRRTAMKRARLLL